MPHGSKGRLSPIGSQRKRAAITGEVLPGSSPVATMSTKTRRAGPEGPALNWHLSARRVGLEPTTR